MKNVVFIAVLFLWVSCSEDPASSGSPVVTTEQWQLTEPTNGGTALLTINEHENGKLSCTGTWTYEFYGNAITCQIMRGTVLRDSINYTFNCSGTASYPPDEDGNVESSPFTLDMMGTFSEASAQGSWEIVFSDEYWSGWEPEPGSFSGSLLEGSGITQ